MLDLIKKFFKLTYKAIHNMVFDDGIEYAGFMTFLMMLAIFPFLVFLTAVLGTLGETELGSKAIQSILSDLPQNMRVFIEPRIKEIILGPPQGILTIVILSTVWSASSALEGTRGILNKAYRVDTPPTYIYRRALSILQFLLLTAILIVATFVLVLIPSFASSTFDFLSNNFNNEFILILKEQFLQDRPYLRRLILAILVTLSIGVLYYILPNINQSFLRTLPGSVFVVVLWYLAYKLLVLYFQNMSQLSLVYGSLVGMVALMLYLFVFNLIFIFGAEFNYILEKALGHKIEEREHVE